MVPIRATIIPSTSPMGTLIKLAPFIPDSLSGFYVIRGSRPSVKGGVSRYPAKLGRLFQSRGKSPGPGEASVLKPSTAMANSLLT